MALLSQAEFARQQGFTRGYVTKLIKKGIVKLKNGKVDSEQAIQSMKAHADPVTLVRPDKSQPLTPEQNGTVDFVTARTMREAFRAKMAKLEYEQKNGQLTDAAQVRSDAFKAGKMVRDGLLALPDRLADLLAAESDPATVRTLLVNEIEAVLHQLSDR
ncbi:hypothetical protein [Endozoicomonas euniceicola]|uniref:Terminase small subunit n=1 Tax=Endozoicomonas euniceicola TaxID=1234143 RepID=A0ABY6GTV1_9GAMM|nr:hypothetical protein [Endozoicomonas euniceicola]UYM16203.1 hypothetical protein NX720_25975 [Endozoicomonas euniceicola]